MFGYRSGLVVTGSLDMTKLGHWATSLLPLLEAILRIPMFRKFWLNPSSDLDTDMSRHSAGSND